MQLPTLIIVLGLVLRSAARTSVVGVRANLCRGHRWQVHLRKDPGNHPWAFSDATVQEKQESTSTWIYRAASSLDLVIFNVDGHHTPALQIFPKVWMSFLVGLPCTVVTSLADRSTINPNAIPVQEYDADSR